ncbi:hypothetical protein JZ751_011674 [Albula glossodonta]|uniref:Uncharacterized protein n=1 Tax=Albula glossodonta TaxID=121402 RepID=A0A8T2PQC7_9TELE|nr:hypothetical protein JZ751_011674 [Albula glossodonta]
MADLEAVLADVSYLMAMEKSKSTPAARASKKIILPEPSIRSVMQKYLEERDELTFDKIFNQKIGECSSQNSSGQVSEQNAHLRTEKRPQSLSEPH